MVVMVEDEYKSMSGEKMIFIMMVVGGEYMRCENCDSNFRTKEIPDDKDRVCYKCGHNNGKVVKNE